MADYGVFRKRDCERIRRSVHTTEGTPRTYVHIPKQTIRSSGGANRTTSDGLSSPWTILEYDAATGEHIRGLDRGKRRNSATSSQSTEVLFHTDDDGNNWIYGVGNAHINRDTGILTKWNADTGERVWDSDAGANTGPIFATTAANNRTQRMCVASDGYIWVLGTDTANVCIGRFNPDTGAQTHKAAIAVTLSQADAIVALPVDGKVLVSCSASMGGGVFVRVYDNTATSAATLTLSLADFVINGSLIYATTVSNLVKIYDFSLTEQDSRAAPGAEVYGPLNTDGTTVWTTTTNGATPMIRAYDASNLATENWNAAQDASLGTPRRIMYENSALYTFSAAVRKHSAVDGSETWQSSGSFFAPTVIAVSRQCCAVGSDFVMVGSGDTTSQVFCLEDSDGTVRWFDEWSANVLCTHVTADDRVFVSGLRIGP